MMMMKRKVTNVLRKPSQAFNDADFGRGDNGKAKARHGLERESKDHWTSSLYADAGCD